MTALALREDQDYWDDRQLAVLHQTGIGEDVTKAELASFLHECQQRKLDPFTKQIYLIGRYDKRAGRNVYRSQTGIDGFRLIARRAADKSGETIEYEDTIWFDADEGKHEAWLDNDAPAACRVVVLRNGKRFPVTARFSSYVQQDRDGRPLGLWAKMPDNQIAKCCEALALRKAFPEELGGIYTDEEMAQADNPQRVQATVVEVISDKRHGEPGADEAQSAAAVHLPVRDEAWIKDAIDRASGDLNRSDCLKLWKESAEKVAAREITKADAGSVQAPLRARLEILAREEQQKAAVIDPDHPWAVKIGDLASAWEAGGALAELAGLEDAGHIGEDEASQARTAILARFPDAVAETAVAA